MVSIAVVGAGIGGCSAAYFAHKLLSNPEITVYEKTNRIGGRIQTFKDEQITTELGGTFFNSSNPTVSPLIAETGLPVKKLEEFMDFAVWNGTEVIFQSNHPMFLNMLKLFTKYKLNVPRLLKVINTAHSKLGQMYKAAEQPAEFWQLFEATGLDKWYKHRFDALLLEAGIDQAFIDELITPITRIIYSQNAEMAGFAGLVALLGVYSEALYSIKDGNTAFPQALLEKSGSKLQLETNVTCIEKTADQTFHVHDETNSAAFDAVIVASPLETAKIQFDGTENQNIPKREYQQIHIRLMKGVVTPQFFNMDAAAKLPSIILTSKQADPITRFSVNKLNHNESMVTITSTKPVDDSLVTELFKNGKTVHDHTWTAAYPVFKPTQNLPNTYLDNGVFYLNAIESSASSMESSTFAALNSIRTIKQQLTKTPNWR